MNRFILLSILFLTTVFYSCKEVPILIDRGVVAEDTTYIASIETPQTKAYLVEELSGVRCVNCPKGMAALEDLNTNGEFAGKLNIVSIHAGTFTQPHKDYSKQGFEFPEAIELLNYLEGDNGKPCAGFDRHPLGPGGTILVENFTSWGATLQQAKNINSATPVNVELTSAFNTEMNRYDITVKVSYTQNVTAKNALTIYLIENDIKEAMIYSSADIDTNFIFSHVLRKILTPYNGKEILNDFETKEAGRVYEYKTHLTIDESHAQEKFWKPENMKLVAFVHNIPSSGLNKKSVLQSIQVNLQD